MIWETAKNRTSGDFEQTMNSTGSTIEEVYIGADQKATAQFRVNILGMKSPNIDINKLFWCEIDCSIRLLFGKK